jgi:hypothetical protein
MIDEVARLLSRLMARGELVKPEESQLTLTLAFERLFGREAVQIFQLTPDQQYLLLGEGEPPDAARDKRLLYAALNAEAARLYDRLGRTELARASRLNALRFALRASQDCPNGDLPAYAPDPSALVTELGATGLDPETADLVRAAGSGPGAD